MKKLHPYTFLHHHPARGVYVYEHTLTLYLRGMPVPGPAPEGWRLGVLIGRGVRASLESLSNDCKALE